MKCPSCERDTDNTTNCKHCNTDLVLYQKVHMMAVRLYNKGLEQAQGRCLSGAIESLSMCIRLQKNYTDARNLLGLVYWEVGEVGQAIKQWVISVSYEKEDNLAQFYLDTIQQDSNALDQYSGSILLYNKAFDYIAKDSQDMAAISLRKAIAQNPKYIEAKVLLSLHYITTNQLDKAKSQLQEVNLITKDHPKAGRYWAQIKGDLDQDKAEAKGPQTKPSRSMQPIAPKMTAAMIGEKSGAGKTIGAFVLGAICMLAVYGILIAPSKTASLQKEITIAKENAEKVQDELEAIKGEQGDIISALQAENKALQENNESLEKEQAIQKQRLAFQSAQSLSQSGQWVEAADQLHTVDKTMLEEGQQGQYDALKDNVNRRAGELLYRDGYNQYQRQAYDDALQLLEKSYLYAKDQYYSHTALFTIGRIYEDQGNEGKAKEYYQLVIDNHPGTNSAYNAQRRLN